MRRLLRDFTSYFGLRDYGVDGQIGLEETPEMYVDRIVQVFEEVKRVLRNDGTLWLNLGDSYASNGSKQNNNGSGKSTMGWDSQRKETLNKVVGMKTPKTKHGMKEKDLIGIPWTVAFALRAAGWYLRQEIIWNKPNTLPESVTDRCTKAHEHIFLLSKSKKYFFDHEAVKEPIAASAQNDKRLNKENYSVDRPERGYPGAASKGGGLLVPKGDKTKRNKRSVWTVTTKPFKEAHFATFPEDLIVDCIKAGCREGGIVLDPFMGAGTTALVAKKLNRFYVGCELNSDYITIAKNRIKKVFPNETDISEFI